MTIYQPESRTSDRAQSATGANRQRSGTCSLCERSSTPCRVRQGRLRRRYAMPAAPLTHPTRRGTAASTREPEGSRHLTGERSDPCAQTNADDQPGWRSRPEGRVWIQETRDGLAPGDR